MAAKKQTSRGRRPRSKVQEEPQPWFRRGPRWIAAAIAAPVAVLVIAAAITKVFGLDQGTSATGSPAVGGTHATDSGPPVVANSAQYEQGARNGGTLAFPEVLSVARVTQFANFRGNWQRYVAAARSMGGAVGDDAEVQIELRGNSSQAAVITGMQVVKNCRHPLAGTLYYSPSAAEDTNIEIGFNLDSQFAIPQDYKAGRLSGNFFAEHTISLKRGETQTLLVHAVTQHQFCQFSFRIMVDAARRQYVEKIEDSGKPFVVTATAQPFTPNGIPFSSYHAIYVGGVASPTPGKVVKVSPATYRGA